MSKKRKKLKLKQLTREKLKLTVQRFDTAIANITAVSLNSWLIKLVKEQSFIFCKSKFTACVILKEH